MAITINGSTGVQLDDNDKQEFGNSADLKTFHDGTNSYLKNTTGALRVQGDLVQITDVAGGGGGDTMASFYSGGAANLYYDNSKKFETTNLGAQITGELSLTTHLKLLDDQKVVCGAGEDLKIFHNGSDSYIEDSGTGSLILDSNEIKFQKYGTSEVLAKFISDGACELYYDNTKRFETDPDGVQVTGTIQAHKSISDSDYTSHAYHVFQQDANDISLAIFEHSGDSTPYGPIIDFSDASPDGNTRYFLDCIDSTARRMVIFSDGDVWTSDSGTLSSDETLKENIVDATPKLEDLKKLKVRNFNWKSSFHPEKSKQKQLGFIAQEVEEVFPSLVSEHDIFPGLPGDGHVPVMKKAIKQAWDPIIIKAMQELIAKVETLETKVAALEAA